jgi:tetratricopeptide (TPR) repeat protein
VFRRTRMMFVLLILSSCFLILPAPARAQKDGDDVVIGKYRIFHSRIFDEDRLLLVHLPRGYETEKISYPVLFHLYGDNINDYIAPAMVACEKLGETGEAPPVIIVGVANTDRYRDNLPFRPDGSPAGADTFLRFFKEELIPFIDAEYRTKPFRLLAGPQAGSVFALYSLVTDPAVFDFFVTTNPFEGDERMTRRLLALAEKRLSETARLENFFYMACEDSDPALALEQAKALAAAVEAARPEGFQFHSVVNRASGFFITPVPVLDALRTFFDGFRLNEDVQVENLGELVAHYEKLSEVYGFAVDVPEHTLTFAGANLQRRGKFDEAIEIHEYQRRLYPGSLNALFQLGEIHRNLGHHEKALEFYKAFLSIRSTDADMVVRRAAALERYVNGSAVFLVEREIEKSGLEAGLKLFRKLKNDPQNTRTFAESDWNALGYKLLNRGRAADAVRVFAITVELYPRSANAYDSLGEAYMKAGDTKKAVENYRKSLELDPKNTNAAEMLKKLLDKKS